MGEVWTSLDFHGLYLIFILVSYGKAHIP